MITPPLFSIVETSSHSPYQSLKIESFLLWLFPFGTRPRFQCLISKILGWYPHREIFLKNFFRPWGDFSAEKTIKFVLFPTILEEESFQGAPHLSTLGISSKFQQMMRWVQENIAAEAYITHGMLEFFLFFCFFNQCRWSFNLDLPSQFLLTCSWVLFFFF